MIRSKIDALKEDRLTACNNLERALATQRGSREARSEAHDRRRQAAESGKCCSCGAVILDKSDPAKANFRLITETGNCSSCDAAIRRMLAFKSKLKADWPREKLIQRFISDYHSMPNPPYSLRGCTSREDILAYAEELLYVTTTLETEVKRVAARNKTARE